MNGPSSSYQKRVIFGDQRAKIKDQSRSTCSQNAKVVELQDALDAANAKIVQLENSKTRLASEADANRFVLLSSLSTL